MIERVNREEFRVESLSGAGGVVGPFALHRKVEVGSNYLALAPDVSDQDIREILVRLRQVETSYQWILGDFLCQVEKIRGNDMARAMIKSFEVSEGRAYDARKVCAFIPREKRREISFTHHLTALYECDLDADLALQFLDRAIKDGWPVSQLRKAIRLASAEPGRITQSGGCDSGEPGQGSELGSKSVNAPGPGPGSTRASNRNHKQRESTQRHSYSELYQAIGFVGRVKPEDMDSQDRVILRADMQAVVK